MDSGDAHELLTAEEFERMPDEGNLYELVRGRLVVKSRSDFRHGQLVMRIGQRMANHVEAHGLGRVIGGDPGCTLERLRVRASWISARFFRWSCFRKIVSRQVPSFVGATPASSTDSANASEMMRFVILSLFHARPARIKRLPPPVIVQQPGRANRLSCRA